MISSTQRDVWRFLASQVGADEADDLAQETYLRAIRTLPGFQGRSSVLTWLLVIARRVMVDDVRRRTVRPRSAGGADWMHLAEQAQLDPRHACPPTVGAAVEFELVLAPLRPERREVLVLTQLLGLSYAEAAQVCGCPIGTVRSRVARAWEDLRQLSESTRPGGRTAG